VRVIVLQFLANRPQIQPETGGTGTIGLVSDGGFDVSALLLGSLAAFVRGGGQAGGEPASASQPEGTSQSEGTSQPEATSETTAAPFTEAPSTEAPSPGIPSALVEAGEQSQLVKLVADKWRVGWMGVEG
jgi:hypothetical protein